MNHLKISLYGLGILTVFFCLSAFQQTSGLKESIARGKNLYTTYCQNCHMENGKGVPGAFPTLQNSEYLKKPSKVLINIVLLGQSGPITVNGTSYNGQMPAQNYLTDEQIADVLNYTKNSWGNKSSIIITPALVKKERQ